MFGIVARLNHLQELKDAATELDESRTIQLADLDQLDASFRQALDRPIGGHEQMISQRLRGGIENAFEVLFGGVAAAAGVEQVVVFGGEFR